MPMAKLKVCLCTGTRTLLLSPRYEMAKWCSSSVLPQRAVMRWGIVPNPIGVQRLPKLVVALETEMAAGKKSCGRQRAKQQLTTAPRPRSQSNSNQKEWRK